MVLTAEEVEVVRAWAEADAALNHHLANKALLNEVIRVVVRVGGREYMVEFKKVYCSPGVVQVVATRTPVQVAHGV